MAGLPDRTRGNSRTVIPTLFALGLLWNFFQQAVQIGSIYCLKEIFLHLDKFAYLRTHLRAGRTTAAAPPNLEVPKRLRKLGDV